MWVWYTYIDIDQQNMTYLNNGILVIKRHEIMTHVVLVCFLLLWWNTGQKQLGVKGFIWLIIACHRASWKPGQKAGVKRWSRDHRGILLTHSLHVASSFTFHMQPGSVIPGMTLPLVGWDPLHQSANKKIPHRLRHRPFRWRQFLN